MGNGYIRAAVLSVALAAASTACSSKEDKSAPEKPDPTKYGRITLDCDDIVVKTDITGINNTSLPDGAKAGFYSGTEPGEGWTTKTDKAVFRYEQPNTPGRFVQLVVTNDLTLHDGEINDATGTQLEVVASEIDQAIFDEPLNRNVAREAFDIVVDSGFTAEDFHEPDTFIEVVENGDDSWQRQNFLESGETIKFPVVVPNYTGAQPLEVPCAVKATFPDR